MNQACNGTTAVSFGDNSEETLSTTVTQALDKSFSLVAPATDKL